MVQVKGYKLFDDLYYSRDHGWVKKEHEEILRIGVDDFYQKEIGIVNGIILPFIGERIYQGKICARIFSDTGMNRFCAPVSGKIIAVNKNLSDNGLLINQQPYTEGWIALVKPYALNTELRNLIHGRKIKKWLEKEIQDLEKAICPSCGFDMQAVKEIILGGKTVADKYYFCAFCYSYCFHRYTSKFCVSTMKYNS